jgi:hypothetical protein
MPSLVPHDAVELGKSTQDFIMAEAGIVPSNGEMATDPGLAEKPGQAPILGKKILEDQRKPDYQWGTCDEPLSDRLRAIPDVDHFHGSAVLSQYRREIAHPKVALILIADQGDV